MNARPKNKKVSRSIKVIELSKVKAILNRIADKAMAIDTNTYSNIAAAKAELTKSAFAVTRRGKKAQSKVAPRSLKSGHPGLG